MAARVALPITHKRGRCLLGAKETGGVAKAPAPLERGLHWKLRTRPQDQKGGGPHAVTQHKQRAHARHGNVTHTQDTLGAAALMVDNGNRPHPQPAPCDTPCGRKPQGLAHHNPTTPNSQQAAGAPTHSGKAAAAGTQHCASVCQSSMCSSPTAWVPGSDPCTCAAQAHARPLSTTAEKKMLPATAGAAGAWLVYGENQVTQGPPQITDAAYMQYNFSSM